MHILGVLFFVILAIVECKITVKHSSLSIFIFKSTRDPGR